MIFPYRLQHWMFFLIALQTVQGISTVEYTVTIAERAETTTGAFLFKNIIGVDYAKQRMISATHFIWWTFAQYSPYERKPVREINLLIEKRSRNFVQANEIHLGTRYIEGCSGNKEEEIIGLFYHHLTEIWQWNGEGKILPGLKTGIADFVRLKAGYAKREWVEPGEGVQWDQGYDVTARFLEYCNGISPGFVAKLNKKMKSGYNNSYFNDLMDKTVDQLWIDYKIKYRNRKIQDIKIST